MPSFSPRLTDKKYALSPGPSVLSSFICFAYGGPQARVSSPLTGCSILMTSALSKNQYGGSSCISFYMEMKSTNSPTQDLPVSAYSMAGLLSVSSLYIHICPERTPASTLVISRTRMPANGNVGDSAVAAIERYLRLLDPLRAPAGPQCLNNDRADLGRLIVLGNQSAGKKRWQGRETNGAAQKSNHLKTLKGQLIVYLTREQCHRIS